MVNSTVTTRMSACPSRRAASFLVVHPRVLVFVTLTVALVSVPAAANTVILEGDDGQVRFGDTEPSPIIERVPNADASAADSLAVRGEGGLLVEGALTVEGPLSATLLDLNSTGGSVIAKDITVTNLIVNGAPQTADSGSSGGPCACQQGLPTRLTLYTTSLQHEQFTATAGIAGNTEWYNNWNVIDSQTNDPDGVFTVTSKQQVAVAKNGSYTMTLENFLSPPTVYSSSQDSRHVVVRTAKDGVHLTGPGTTFCLVVGIREAHSATCSAFLRAGTVLGLTGSDGGATETETFMHGHSNVYPTWSITLDAGEL